MDGRRFDGIARAMAEGGLPRRRVLALLAGALAGAKLSRAAAQDAGTPTPDDGACPAGFTACPDGCVDLQADLLNCGACGAVCESGLVSVRCNAGVCERADCAVGQEYCGAADGCRDLQTDPGHCGACGQSCGDGTCEAGVCVPPGGTACAEGETVCDGACVALCCNNDHCGACGNACTGGLTCFEAVCDCPSGLCDDDGTGAPVVALPSTGSGATFVGAPFAALIAGAATVLGWLGVRQHPPSR